MSTGIIISLIAVFCVPEVFLQDPVNRLFSVDAGEPTPDLACVVGFHSMAEEEIYRVNCSEAHKIEIPISYSVRKELKWPEWKRSLRFGSQEDNKPWPEPVASWVCTSFPAKGTVTFNCVPENNAPDWYKAPISGPALGPYQRKPGCNGAVCYCNDRDFCNDGNALHLHSLLLPLVLLAKLA